MAPLFSLSLSFSASLRGILFQLRGRCVCVCHLFATPPGGAKSPGSARDVARSSDRAPACTWQLVATGVALVRGEGEKGGGAHTRFCRQSPCDSCLFVLFFEPHDVEFSIIIIFYIFFLVSAFCYG
ncbi:uncharacterized protein LY79DRAFT_536392 [Colletotrichum navitas]|uniref:Secreted protein n=1 Tax=Colletotrichum navitas TaxID=681940 RepID=A0AAD8QA94_9PEZI|nr:uncharacterized protein LY79DRAFT_536392 [Colletotrichum navitas]KAK1598913.1 hypothetical protein LY79DRAFT_536392 [Colletotrichum navitas]